MSDWFSVEKIDDGTFAISEYGHWEKVHSYLLLGEKCAALIDTGLGIGNIKNVVEHLTNLPVKVVTTHVHWDHIGGHREFNDIYVHENDAAWLEDGISIPLEAVKRDVIREKFTLTPPDDFDINKYEVYRGKPGMVLKDGDIIDIGGRKIDVIYTPEHSPGHICLFEEERGYLFTGDLVYAGTLYAFYPSTDPVKFKESIEKVSKLKGVKRILPGHNNLNIPVSIIRDIKEAFESIEKEKHLKQGAGIFNFKGFNIHI